MNFPGSLFNWTFAILIAGSEVFMPLISARAATYDQNTIDAGVAVWQNQLDVKGRACADCHGSPDGFDMAYFNFTDSDLRRRDANHVGTIDSDKIVAMVNEIRKKYNITSPQDPLTTRVFQPGGVPIVGNTPTERDAGFLQSLQTKIPTLATGTIDSYAKAQQGLAELIAFDIRKEPNGILFPHWSEDIYFGVQHGILTDWIADEGYIPFNTTARTTINNARNVYLANPTEANFWAMYAAITANADVTSTVSDSNQRSLWSDKYLNSVIGAHDLRMLQTGQPRIMDKANTRLTQFYNTTLVFPTWQVGDNVNTVGVFSDDVHASLDPSITDENHVALGKDAWWWLGFTYNNSVEHEPERQEYFPNSLASNIPARRVVQGPGYYTAHSLFMRARSDAVMAGLVNPITGDLPYYGNSGRTNPISPFNSAPAFDLAAPINPDVETDHWFNATHKAQYIQLAVNISKMRMYLIQKRYQDAIASGNKISMIHIDDNIESGDVVDFRCAIFQLQKWDSANATSDLALYNSLMSLREQAKRTNRVPIVGTGNGLNATYFNSLDFTNPVATRIDKKIDFDNGPKYFGGTDGALYSTSNNQISVRWTGYYQPKFTDTYSFYSYMAGDLLEWPIAYGQPGQGASRIWVNNVLVFDMTQPNGSGNVNQGMSPNPDIFFPTVNLEAGKSYPITVEYSQAGSYQRMVLLERSWLQSFNPVSQSQLYTTQPPAGVPSAPNNLVISKLTSTSVRLNWTDYSYNENNFVIQRKTGAAGTYADVGTVGANVTTFDNSGLVTSTNYYYRVRATNASGNSAYSTEALFTTAPGPNIAHLLLYEGFNYALGANLAGGNGGNGWAAGSTWSGGASTVAPVMSFSDYAVTGYAAEVTTNYSAISRNISVAQSSGADLWLSYLFRDNSYNDYNDSDVTSFTDASGGKLQSAPALSGNNASCSVNSVWGAAGANKLANGSTFLMIVKFTKVGKGTTGTPQTATLWALNSSQYDAIKTSTITEALLDANNVAKATASYGGSKGLASGNTFNFYNGRSGQGYIDEIKLATTLGRLFETQ